MGVGGEVAPAARGEQAQVEARLVVRENHRGVSSEAAAAVQVDAEAVDHGRGDVAALQEAHEARLEVRQREVVAVRRRHR